MTFYSEIDRLLPKKSLESVEDATDQKVTIDAILNETNSLNFRQFLTFLAVGAIYFINGAVNLQQIVVEQAITLTCPEGESNCTSMNVCEHFAIANDGAHDVNQFFPLDKPVESVAESFLLVCNNAWMQSSLGSIFFIGFGVGSFLSGLMSDKFGRKITLIVTLIIQNVGGLAFLAPNYIIYSLLRFVCGIGAAGQIVVGCSYLTEFMPQRFRAATCASGLSVLFAVGGCASAAIAWLMTDHFHLSWRYTSFVISMISWTGLCFIFFLRKSPHYLLAQGKVIETKCVLREVLHPVTPNLDAMISKLQLSVKDEKGNEETSERGIFSGNFFVFGVSLRTITLGSMAVWIASSCCYYALSLHSSILPGNVYLNALIMMFIDVPALICSIPLYDFFGRKKSLILGLIVGGLCLAMMSTAIILQLPLLQKISAFIGKFFMQSAFALLFGYTPELYPTDLRSVGVGFCSTFARLGCILAPFILVPSETLGLYFLAIFSTLAGLCAFFLPETAGKSLQD